MMITTVQHVPQFEPGQIVHHHRYDYRGVIVVADRRCLADARWYLSNQTQPNQNQPWYHVLVDGSASTTYVAESNLEADLEGGPIEHPLLDVFFVEFSAGRYVRNDIPWPEL